MKFITNILVLILLVLPACSGVDSVTKKRYQNTENTIVLKDLTPSDFDLQDAGSQLQGAIEDAMADTSYTLAGESARYSLKYKVLEFDGGSRIARIATMGFSDAANRLTAWWFVSSEVTGGIATAGDSLMNPLNKVLDEVEWRPGSHKVPVIFGKLGTWAGAVGAAYTAINFESI